MSDQAVIDTTATPVEPEEEQPEPEAVQPEVVHLPERRQPSAVEAAADAAEALALIPGKEELLTLAMEARMLAFGNLVPAALRGKPTDVFLILLVGRDLGIAQTSALQQVYVVDGKPSLAPKLLNARLRHLRLGGIYRHPANSNTWAAALIVPWAGVERLDRAEAKEDGTPLKPIDLAIDQVEFSWEDAAAAELVTGGCTPGNHLGWCGNKGAHNRQSCGKCHCKDNYRKYPQRMLWWRAAGYAADDFFPEASLGLYSPDELGAVTDEDGKPIDVNSVEVPEGFAKGRGGGSTDEDDGPAPASVLWELQERIQALPDEQRAELKKRWGQSAGLKTPDGGVFPAWHVPASKLKLVHSLLAGCEAQAKATGWDPDRERLRAQGDVADTAAGLLRGLLLFSVLPPWPEADEEGQDQQEAAGEPAAAPEDDEESGPERPAQAESEAPVDPSKPEPWVAEIIEEVRKLDIEEVDARLKLMSKPTTGAQKTRRQRLATAMVHDKQHQTS